MARRALHVGIHPMASRSLKDFHKPAQLELPDAMCIKGSGSDVLPTRAFMEDCLLEVIRIRANGPDIYRIGLLRLPRAVVPGPGFQEMFMPYVPSLVLFEMLASSDEDKNHRQVAFLFLCIRFSPACYPRVNSFLPFF